MFQYIEKYSATRQQVQTSKQAPAGSMSQSTLRQLLSSSSATIDFCVIQEEQCHTEFIFRACIIATSPMR